VAFDVPLTPSGTLAGTQLFPLSMGNGWLYSASGTSRTVWLKSKMSGWFRVMHLLHPIGSNWFTVTQGTQPTVYATASAAIGSKVSALFKLNRPVGTSWTVKLSGLLSNVTLKVVANNEKVVTPAGTFTGCYRLDAKNNAMDAGYSSFWFAPGVGLVQYGKVWIGGVQLYRLHRAKVRGSDGKVYAFGQN